MYNTSVPISWPEDSVARGPMATFLFKDCDRIDVSVPLIIAAQEALLASLLANPAAIRQVAEEFEVMVQLASPKKTKHPFRTWSGVHSGFIAGRSGAL